MVLLTLFVADVVVPCLPFVLILSSHSLILLSSRHSLLGSTGLESFSSGGGGLMCPGYFC